MNLNFPATGTVINLQSSDVFGANSDLSIRIEQIGDGKPIHPNAEWVTVEGTALTADGADRGYRSALVRAEALCMPKALEADAGPE